MSTFYGHYKSSATMKTGCVKEFVTRKSESMGFPPQLNYYCDLCKANHHFRLVNTNIVSTPSQEKRFDEYCNSHRIERDVEVPDK